MSSALDSTFGIWLISAFLETILYGIGLLQVFLYFQWYPRDRAALKATVIVLLVCESLQVAMYYYATYDYLITNFGNFPHLNVIGWADAGQLFCAYMSGIIVQIYFAHTIYAFAKSYRKVAWMAKLSATAVVSLALVQLGSGIAQVVQIQRLGYFHLLEQTKAITSTQSASALACDVLITVTLVFLLDRQKSDLIGPTNSMLSMLITYAVNRGTLTAFCALLNLVLFLALPGTFYFFLGLAPISKLYMNSMLATLNARQHIVSKAHMLDTPRTESPTIAFANATYHGRNLHYVNSPPDVKPIELARIRQASTVHEYDLRPPRTSASSAEDEKRDGERRTQTMA